MRIRRRPAEGGQSSDLTTEPHYSQRDMAIVWAKVEQSRDFGRPQTQDLVELMVEDWVEIHGDKVHEDDKAIIAGIAKLRGQTVAIAGHQKGHDAKESAERHFGMASPSGYRKAMRVMEMANRFKFPFITFVDTEGAYPGVRAEQEGQGGAIARSQAAMLGLEVPVVSTILSRGGSGGAIALAAANKVFMMQRAQYTVISPEGGAAILWGGRASTKQAQGTMESHKREMAVASKGDPENLLNLGVIDGIVPEPMTGPVHDHGAVAQALGDTIEQALAELSGLSSEELIRQRRDKFRAMGAIATK